MKQTKVAQRIANEIGEPWEHESADGFIHCFFCEHIKEVGHARDCLWLEIEKYREIADIEAPFRCWECGQLARIDDVKRADNGTWLAFSGRFVASGATPHEAALALSDPNRREAS